jgi:hypothetical protein
MSRECICALTWACTSVMEGIGMRLSKRINWRIQLQGLVIKESGSSSSPWVLFYYILPTIIIPTNIPTEHEYKYYPCDSASNSCRCPSSSPGKQSPEVFMLSGGNYATTTQDQAVVNEPGAGAAGLVSPYHPYVEV